jgi:hypothetical protein
MGRLAARRAPRRRALDGRRRHLAQRLIAAACGRAGGMPARRLPGEAMKWLVRVFSTLHGVFAAVFVLIALMLLWAAVRTLWQAVGNGLDESSAVTLIEAMGVIAVAVVGLQVAQTIVEEEVVREAHVSAPTRVRRFLSRFIVVIAVALAVEALVATMKALHEDMTLLPHAASSAAGVALLVAAWGYFIRANRAAEDVEPEAMEQAKKEDRKLD